MSWTATTPEDLDATIVTRMIAIDPTRDYQGSRWNPYERQGEHGRLEPISAGPGIGSRSRRFRTIWAEGLPVGEGSVWTNAVIETEARLSIRVDYVGSAADQQAIEWTSIADFHQLRDELGWLAGDSTGLVMITPVSRVLVGPHDDPNVSRFDLSYLVRYLAAQSVLAF